MGAQTTLKDLLGHEGDAARVAGQVDRLVAGSERWRPVAGYEGKYEVSDLGRVRSLARLDSQGRPVVGRILKQAPAGRYASVHLCRDGIAATRSVHILVAAAFLGPTPAGHIVAHGDGNSMNPALQNLRFATPQENEADKVIHGTQFRGHGERNSQARLTAALAAEVATAARSGTESQRAIAARFGIDQSMVSRIKHGRNWSRSTEAT